MRSPTTDTSLGIHGSLGQRQRLIACTFSVHACGKRPAIWESEQISGPTRPAVPGQAELAIEAILAFAQSLEGKWLASLPT